MRKPVIGVLAGTLVVLGSTCPVSAASSIAQHVTAAACSTTTTLPPVKLAQLDGWTESIIVDNRGRLFASQLFAGTVVRIDRPGAMPVTIASNIPMPAGIVVRPDGKLLLGTGAYGSNPASAKLLLMNPDTGASSTYAQGLYGTNGLALAPDGSVYVSTFLSANIAKVSPDRTVTRTWSSSVLSPNGLAISSDGRYLYSDQTAPASSVYRIATDDPAHAEAVYRTSPLDATALPDGMTFDPHGRLVVATQYPGQLLRAQNGGFCTIASGLPSSTQATYGRGSSGFSAGRMFRSGTDGAVLEVLAGYVGAST